MKHIYSFFAFCAFIFILSGCLEDPVMDTGLQQALIPELGTVEVGEKTATTISVSSSVIKENGSPLLKRGFKYWQVDKDNDDKLIGAAKDTFETDNLAKGAYSMLIQGLKNNATYKMVAAAANEVGINYSRDTVQFSTNRGIGAVKTVAVSLELVTATTAKVEGIVTNKGEGELKDYGFELYVGGKKDTTFRKADGVIWEEADSTFSYVIENLKQMTDYEVRAFAENSFGSFDQDGKQRFTTKDGRPVLKDSISIVTDYDFVTLGSLLVSKGDADIQEVGFTWTTVQDALRPNIAEDDTVHAILAEDGSFTGKITKLEAGITYYARAYAKNTFGIVYTGDSVRIAKKRDLPTVVLNAASTYVIENGTVTIGGELQDAGKSAVTAFRLYYSTNVSNTEPSPTKHDGYKEIELGEDEKTFTVSLKLLGGKKYYVRLFAQNGSGVASSENTENFTLPNIYTEKKAFTGDGRQDFMTFTLGDKAFVLGGKVGNEYTNSLYGYSTNSNTWTTLSSSLKSIVGGSITTNGVSAYLIGGKDTDYNNDVYSYTYNEWETIPSMQLINNMQGTSNAISFVHGESLVVLGGEKKITDDNRGLLVQDSIFSWNGSSWNVAGNFPIMIKEGIALAKGDSVIVGMGSLSTDSISENSTVNRSLWLHVDGDTWSNWELLTDAPTSMGLVSTGVIKDSNVFVLDDKAVIWKYNLDDKKWYRCSTWNSGISDLPEYKILLLQDTIYLLAINNFGSSSFVTYNPMWDIATEQE